MDKITAIINFVLIAGVIQGFVFNIVTLFSGKKFSRAILYLNLTVLFISLNNLQAWLSDNNYIPNDLFYIKQLLVPWYLFILPFFYSFLRYFLHIQKLISGYVKTSVILFGIELILRLGVISYTYYFDDKDLYNVRVYTIIEDLVNLVFSLFIFYKAWVLVFKKERTYKNILSYDDLSWVKLFLRIGFFVMMLWVFAKMIDVIYENDSGYVFLRLADSILLYWIGYRGLIKYYIVQDRIQLRSNISSRRDVLNLGDGYPSEWLNDKHLDEFNKINAYILENQRFLDPNLTMNILALEMDMSVSHFSKLVNKYSGYNFSDYINALRVEQAKKLLSDPEFNRYTIISVGLECGFNSKSTFYSAFKKFTNLTPTDYQQQKSHV